MTHTTSTALADLPTPTTEEQLRSLKAALQLAYSAATSADAHRWNYAHTRSYGHCAVVALIVQDLHGGTLARVEVNDIPPGSFKAETCSHYYNILPDGRPVDLTRDQFGMYRPGANVSAPAERSREYVLSFAPTAARYEALRVAAGLA